MATKSRIRSIILIALVVQFCCLVACQHSVVQHEYTPQDSRTALTRAREHWHSRLPEMAGYDLNLEVRCYCTHAGHYRLRVRPGQPNELVPDRPVNMVPEHLLAIVRGYDVEGLFHEVETALDEKAARVDVIYDQGYGYPIDLQIDGDAQMPDDELQILATLTTFPREARK